MKLRKISLAAALMLAMSMTVSAAETEAVTEAAASEAFDMSAAKWSDYVIQINDEIYQFPMAYEDLLAMGWTTDDVEGVELEPYQYSFFYFDREDVSMTVYIVNLGINTLPAEECIVGGISIDAYDWELDNGTITLPGGIVRGEATVEDIEAAYGTASDTYEGDMYTNLTYETDYNSSVDLYVYKESGVLEEIEVENFVEPEGFVAGEVSEEVPEAIASYAKPEALSDDMTAYEIELDGQVYTMPVPVSVLIADGWEMDASQTDEYISAAYFGWVTLRKGGQEIHTTAVNQEPSAMLPQNCWIEELEVGGYSLEADGALPGGVRIGIAEKEFLAILEENGMEYEVESSGDFTYYTYNGKEYDQCMEVTVYTAEDGNFPQDTVIEVVCSNAFE